LSNIGILGGTFNPIHIGHIELAKYAYLEAKLDKVFIMPSGVSYLKKEQEIPNGKIRYEICQNAIDGYFCNNKDDYYFSAQNYKNYFSVSDIEINRTGNTYTYETLIELNKRYPNDELFFIIGADSLYYIDKWVNADNIFKLCTIVAAKRGSDTESDDEKMNIVANKLRKEYNAKILLLNHYITDISSTKIRQMFYDNIGKAEILKYIPEKEYDYIIENGIYKN